MMRINLAPPDSRARRYALRPKLPRPRFPAFDLPIVVGVLYSVTVLALLLLGALWWHLSAQQAQLAEEVQRQTAEFITLQAEVQRHTSDVGALKARVDQGGKIQDTLAELQQRLDAMQVLGKRPGATARLNDVVVQKVADGTATAVHLRTSLVPRYRPSFIDTPSRLVIDMDDVTFGWRGGPLALDIPPLRQVRASQFRKGVTRVVIEFTGPAQYTIHEEPAGLVIIVPIATGAAARSSRSATNPSSDGIARFAVLRQAHEAATAPPVGAARPSAGTWRERNPVCQGACPDTPQRTRKVRCRTGA